VRKAIVRLTPIVADERPYWLGQRWLRVLATAITRLTGHLIPTRSEERTTLCHSAKYGPYVWPKDEQRIEEERAGIARPAPATLASSHLAQALDAFDDACSPEAVLTPRKIWPLRQSDSAQARRTLSEITQRNFCASATLFTAFAAEAFVNNFLQVHDLQSKVSPAKFRKLAFGSTVKKYLRGVALAYEPLFEENDEVMPSITELFGIRNKLAHPRLGLGPPVAYMPDPTWRSMYAPTKVAGWLVAVAGAAELMEVRCYGFDYNSLPAAAIWHGRTIVLDLAADSQPLPPASTTARAPLIQLLAEAQASRPAQLAGLKLTVDEIREARLKHAAELGPWDKFTELLTRKPDGVSDEG